MSLYTTGVVRIISEPERKVFDSGSYITKFYGGSNEGKDKNGEYIKNGIDVEIWNKGGDIIYGDSAFARVGDSVLVTGKVMRQQWTDKESQEVRSKHVLEAFRIELLPRGGDGQPAPARQAAPAAPAPASNPFDSEPDLDDEIPF